jgi:type IV fimbrial biogenesis protein FimT
MLVCRSWGFTLIELLVTVAVSAILLTVAIPSFREIIMNNRLAAQANEFVTALSVARTEALKRSAQVTVCKSSDGASCGGVNWEDGWIVFTDPNNPWTVDAGEQILRVDGKLSGGNTLRTGGNFADAFAYLPSGRTKGKSGLANDTFRLCDSRGTAKAKAIVVSTTGRVQTKALTDPSVDPPKTCP